MRADDEGAGENLVAGAQVQAKVRVVLAKFDGGDGEDITGSVVAQVDHDAPASQ